MIDSSVYMYVSDTETSSCIRTYVNYSRRCVDAEATRLLFRQFPVELERLEILSASFTYDFEECLQVVQVVKVECVDSVRHDRSLFMELLACTREA